MSIFRLTQLAGVALLATLVAAGTAMADPVGAQSFVDLGNPTANGSPTGNINTATAFMIGDLTSTTDNEGVFFGMPAQGFGSVSFNTTIPTSLDFGNSVFGHFASSSITEIANDPGAVAFFVVGQWTPGTFGSVTGGPFSAEFTISLDQTPAHNGLIADSATFALPATTPIPEPSSLLLGLTGLAALALIYGHRRRPRHLAMA